MAAYHQVNNYLNNYYEGMNQEQLILLLFNGFLNRIELCKQGIEEQDIKKKGENLSSAIAIIAELNASVSTEMNDESTRFLRGLYTAILMELSRVTLNNDCKILDRAQAYIKRLKQIWEEQVMTQNCNQKKAKKTAKTTGKKYAPVSSNSGGAGQAKAFSSISV